MGRRGGRIMKLYKHKKTNALLKEIKQTENLVVCFKLNEDRTIKRVNNFCSPHTREAKAICRKDEQMEALKKLYRDDLINGRI